MEFLKCLILKVQSMSHRINHYGVRDYLIVQ